MKIDFLLGPVFGRGGVETVVAEISNGLRLRGHQIRVLQMYPVLFQEWLNKLPGVTYIGPPISDPAYGQIIRDFAHDAARLADFYDKHYLPDVLLATHSPIPVLVASHAFRNRNDLRPPVVSWLHSPPEAYQPMLWMLNHADAHIAISTDIRYKLRKCLSREQPIYLIHNPIKQDNIRPIARSKGDMFHFVFVGRLENREKRVDLLIESISKLTGQFYLHLIGDGPDRDQLMKLAAVKKVSRKIKWYGWVEDPWSVILHGDLLVVPSAYEGFSMVSVEALARGIPVLATDCGGPRDIVTEGVGWLFPPGDGNALYKILQSILDGQILLPQQDCCMKAARRFYINDILDKFVFMLTEMASLSRSHRKCQMFD